MVLAKILLEGDHTHTKQHREWNEGGDEEPEMLAGADAGLKQQQKLMTIPELTCFVTLADELLETKKLTDKQYATLVYAIFSGYSVVVQSVFGSYFTANISGPFDSIRGCRKCSAFCTASSWYGGGTLDVESSNPAEFIFGKGSNGTGTEKGGGLIIRGDQARTAATILVQAVPSSLQHSILSTAWTKESNYIPTQDDSKGVMRGPGDGMSTQ